MTDFDIDIPEIHFPDTIELDDDIDFSVADFSIVDEEEQTRIIKPKMAKSAIYNKADFQYARDLAAKICLERNARTTCIVPGNFIFGDLPEALVMYRGIDLKTIYCSTLSLSENNVDSFKNLLLFRNVEKINLMLSGYSAHENPADGNAQGKSLCADGERKFAECVVPGAVRLRGERGAV